MKKILEIDWLQATEGERKQLYVATKAVADAADISVAEILDAALGRKVLMGTDYQSNFRRGKIRRSYAKLIYGWISETHQDIASKIAPELFIPKHTPAWGDYLDQHAKTGSLRIATFNQKTLGLVERARSKPKPEYTLKLGAEFCFHLTSDRGGYAVAFQEYAGEIHPIPLGLEGELITLITAGEQFLPLDEDGRPDPLSEGNDIGLHWFVVIVATDQNHLTTAERITEHRQNTECHIVPVKFAAT